MSFILEAQRSFPVKWHPLILWINRCINQYSQYLDLKKYIYKNLINITIKTEAKLFIEFSQMTLPHRSDLFQRFQSFSGFTETSRDDKLPPRVSSKHSESAVDSETLL